MTGRVSILRIMTGVVVWLVMSYIGGIYFFGTLSLVFAIGGFVIMFLIIYWEKWYPRVRRWRRGY
jgi:hypothetical protein